MKKIIIVMLIVLNIIFVRESKALEFKLDKIILKPSATPTLTPTPTKKFTIIDDIKLDKDILIKLPSATPTKTVVVVTQVVTQMVTPAPEGSEIENTEVTNTPTGSQVTAAPEKKATTNKEFWFMAITILALLVIVVVQAWPKKKNQDL